MNYETSAEDIDTVTKVLTVSIPSKEVEDKYSSEIAALSKKVKMKGFRPGKAPADLVVKMHGPEARAEVVNKLISTSLGEIVREQKINYVGQPQLTIETSGQGEDLKFKAHFSLYPVAELKKYDSFKIRLPEEKVGDEDVTRVINRIRSSSAQFEKIADRTEIKKGDAVQCQVQALIDGAANGEPSSMRIVVGEEETPPEVNEALSGMKLGETKRISVKSISEDERNEGKEIQYDITPQELFEKILPELTDEFAKTVDKDVASVLELRLKISELLEKDRKEQSRSRAEGLILRELANSHDFIVPQVMIDMEIYNMLARGRMIEPSKLPFEQFQAEMFREQMGRSAEERVKASVLVDKIVEAEKLTPTEEETKEWFDQQRARLGEEVFKQFLSDQGYVQSMWVDFTRKKGLDFLMTKTHIDYISLEEFEKEEKAAQKENQKKSEAAKKPAKKNETKNAKAKKD